MITTALSEISRKHVTSVPAALKALAAMDRELSRASTYVEIHKIRNRAEALKLLFRDIDIVKAEAEDVILSAAARIGEEVAKLPKGNARRLTAQGKSSSNRKDAMPSGTTRARYQKLAAAKSRLKAIAKSLREQGKDATPTAVVRELTQGDKRQQRAGREQELATKITALPDRKYGVILADPEWRFEPWSRETGMDRAADNHYSTSPIDMIKARNVPSIAADDCALFLWATAPMLPQALAVMEAWCFTYKTHAIWRKTRQGERRGTGYWFHVEHEILLVGTRGNVPAPAPGTQWTSVIDAPVGRHSEKPTAAYELIEAYFPNLPKIELNARRRRPGWHAWGLEVPEEESVS